MYVKGVHWRYLQCTSMQKLWLRLQTTVCVAEVSPWTKTVEAAFWSRPLPPSGQTEPLPGFRLCMCVKERNLQDISCVRCGEIHQGRVHIWQKTCFTAVWGAAIIISALIDFKMSPDFNLLGQKFAVPLYPDEGQAQLLWVPTSATVRG